MPQNEPYSQHPKWAIRAIQSRPAVARLWPSALAKRIMRRDFFTPASDTVSTKISASVR